MATSTPPHSKSIVQITQQYLDTLVAYDYEQVHLLRAEVVDAIRNAHTDQLATACDMLTDSVAAFNVEDADGTPHAAFLAGVLVSAGAPPRRLGQVLLDKLASILEAARRYTDLCIAHLNQQTGEEGRSDGRILTKVDGYLISAQVHNLFYDDDEAGGSALEMLYKWVLPTLATLTRDHTLLRQARRDARIGLAVRSMSESEAVKWLHRLFCGEFDATWLVYCVKEDRAFQVRVDGIVTNHTLHALMADALISRGIPGTNNSPNIISFLKGDISMAIATGVSPATEASGPPTDAEIVAKTITCPFQYMTYEAGAHDWSQGNRFKNWIAADQWPHSIPFFQGMRTIIVGPEPPVLGDDRAWSTYAALPTPPDPILTGDSTADLFPFKSPFAFLKPRVEIVHELSEDDVRMWKKSLLATLDEDSSGRVGHAESTHAAYDET